MPKVHTLRDVKICDTFWKRFRGLMFSHRRTVLLVFDRAGRHAIHMFFVFFPITVVWLDAGGRVVEAHKASPFSPLHRPREKAERILEIPAHGGLGIEVGDRIIIETSY